MAHTKISKTIGYYVAFVALGLVAASLGPTLPGLAKQTQTLLSQISILFTTRSLGYLVGCFQGGRLYDRRRGHPVMAGTLIVIALMMAVVPLMSLLWLLMIVLLILGMAEGALDVGGNTLLVWIHRQDVGPFMNALHFFFGLGAFLSPIIIARIMIVTGGIAWAYWILAVLVLPTALWLLFLPSPRSQHVSEDTPIKRSNPRLVMLIALFLFLYVGIEVSFGGWIFTYSIKLNLSSETTAAYLTSAFWGTFTLGRLLAIPLAARFRPRSILFSDLIACLVCVGIIVSRPHSLVVLWLGTLGTGLAIASVFATTLSMAERLMTITGKVTGWFLVGASGGAMFVPWLIGQFFEFIGPKAMMFIILVDAFLAIGVLVILIVLFGDTHYSTPTSDELLDKVESSNP